MTHHENVKMITFVGLPGSGKSEAVTYLTDKSIPRIYAGGVIYDAMDKMGIERTQENETKFRVDIRAQQGVDFVFKEVVKQANDLIAAGQRRIVIDGLKTWDEYKITKQEFPGELSVVAVVAPRHLRHHRLSIRPHLPLTDPEASARDWHEIEDVGAGGPIAIADHYIINDGNIEKLHQSIDAVISDLEF